MMKKIFATILLLLVIAIAGVVGYRAGRQATLISNGDVALQTSKIKAILGLIQNRYVDSVSLDQLVDACIPAILGQLDPHTRYLTAKERQAELPSLEGKFSGVGVTFNNILDTVIVISVIPNGPSYIAGIQAGDRITAVDGKGITGDSIPTDSIMGLLRGPSDSLVDLSVYRPSTQEELVIQVKRGEVPVNQVNLSYMINDSLGFIHINQFSVNTYEEFVQAYASLLKDGMKALVLDLRNNPGGVLRSALLMSNEFLSAGQKIIYTEGAHAKRNEMNADGRGSLQSLPIYVLVNEKSASASEILSGSLQDNDRAIVIGRRTFGKGLVQEPIEFRDGSAINLTIARYYTGSGRCIQRPYERGDDQQYYSDFYRRFQNGELYHRDSIHYDSAHVYHTLSGRPVYGGGGIVPDVFVSEDSIGYNSYLKAVLVKGLVQKFAFIYADKYRDFLSEFSSADKCYSYLKAQGLVWLFARYAYRSGGVQMKNYLIVQAVPLLEPALCRMIISYIYGESEASRVLAGEDRMVNTVIDLYKRGIVSPINLMNSDIEFTEDPTICIAEPELVIDPTSNEEGDADHIETSDEDKD